MSNHVLYYSVYSQQNRRVLSRRVESDGIGRDGLFGWTGTSAGGPDQRVKSREEE